METKKLQFQANNVVILEGIIDTFFEYDHSWEEQRFYNFTLAVKRTSGKIDYIPCSISNKIIGEIRDWRLRKVKVIGRYNSYGKYVDGKNIKIYNVNVLSLELISQKEDDDNMVVLLGKLISGPRLRVTKKGKRIADLQISVKNNSGKMNSFPVIAWGETIDSIKYAIPGTPMKVVGRIESRKKRILDDAGNTVKELMVYEISSKDIEIDEDFDVVM